jgi:putative ATP-dependent endonuclease of OLD family
MANYEGKGWFAILLGNRLDEKASIPAYITDAVFFGATVTRQLWVDIFQHRLRCIAKSGGADPDAIETLTSFLDGFQWELFDIGDLKSQLKTSFPQDALNRVLARLPDVLA